WRIKADLSKEEIGQLYLEENSEIKITDTLPEGLTYDSMANGPEPEPISEGNELVWIFPVPKIDEQDSADHSLFSTELEVVLTTGANTADEELTNHVEMEATFIGGTEGTAKAEHSIKVFESDPSSGEIEGSVYVPNHAGPSDGKGN